MTLNPESETREAENQDLGLLAVCGISYNTATLSEREPFQINRHDLVPALQELRSIRAIHEGLILSTCNRFEAYMVLQEGEEAFRVLREFFIRFRGTDAKPLRRLFYVHHGSTVARHLFRVTGGLDSMVLGEYQIQGQVKEAYSAACSVKVPSKVLHRLFHAAFRAGKSIRTHTSVGAGRMSVAGMAANVLKERVTPEDPLLFVGANENIRIVAEELKGSGFNHLSFANRTRYKGEKLARRYGGEGFGLDELPELLSRFEVLVSCTGAPTAIITAELLEALVQKKSHPKLLIDMAVPRDIERPKNSSIPMEIIDLEDLKCYRNDRLNGRKNDLPAAECIVEDMVTTFQCWMEGAFDASLGARIKEFERIRQTRLVEALASFKAEDKEALEHFSRALMQDLLKVPPIKDNGSKGE